MRLGRTCPFIIAPMPSTRPKPCGLYLLLSIPLLDAIIMTHFNLRFSRRQIFQSWRQYQHKKRVLCCKHHQVRHHLIASPGQHSLFTSLLALHRPQAESDHMTEKHRGREKEEKGGKLINAEHTKGTSDKGSKGNFPCVHLALC